MPDEALLEARGIAWEVDGRPILEPTDLTLGSGECVAVVGPNGAGKTTLLRLLAGLIAPTAGELSWSGRLYAALSRRELARHIAYVPQVRPARIPLTVEEMVVLGRFPYLSPFQMAPSREDLDRVAELLARTGLTALAQRRLDALSGGERQSVFITSALAQDAEVLILDEPTTHLDPRHQRDVAELLLDLRAASAQSILLTTHDLNLAARLADRIVALRGGRLVDSGAPRELVTPERMGEVFGAPFDAVGEQEAPRVLLRLER